MTNANEQTKLLVLAAGEDLFEKLEEFATASNLAGAWVQGLGSSRKVTLGFYSPEMKEYQWQGYTDPLEVTNLQGNLAWVDDKPFWHIHGTFSGPDFAASAGHVRDLQVGLTLELLITPLSTAYTRTYDEETGLKILGTS